MNKNILVNLNWCFDKINEAIDKYQDKNQLVDVFYWIQVRNRLTNIINEVKDSVSKQTELFEGGK